MQHNHIGMCCSIYQRRRQWHPTPVLLPAKSHGERSLVGCSPWGREESDTTERLHFHFSLSCIGERNGNPLQCSCLENPRDGGAWWAVVYRVAQSRTRLKRLSSSSSSRVGAPAVLDCIPRALSPESSDDQTVLKYPMGQSEWSRSLVSDSATPWTVTCQDPLSMGFSRQEYWSRLPFPSPWASGMLKGACHKLHMSVSEFQAIKHSFQQLSFWDIALGCCRF